MKNKESEVGKIYCVAQLKNKWVRKKGEVYLAWGPVLIRTQQVLKKVHVTTRRFGALTGRRPNVWSKSQEKWQNRFNSLSG